MTKRILSIISIGVLSIFGEVSAQDIHFSQFYETTILRNPALTGIFSDDFKVSANYRNQWSSISQPFVTGQVSFETKIPVNQQTGDFFSVGLLANMDKAGTVQMKSLALYPVLSFSKSLGDANHSFLSAGFTGGFVQRSFDPSRAAVNNQYGNGGFDPYAGTGENIQANKISHLDVGAGLNFSSGAGEYSQASYFIGVSGYHLTKPRNSFY
ncbi:MAG: type IX secretion system membrane protein PorP/SprF, partial [Sphingobacteriales bacterium]